MTIIYSAATVLVNPGGATPTITQEQLWAGLELKRRQPQLFLPVIDTCQVLEDDGKVVLREVTFKDGSGIGHAPTIGPRVRERITHIAPISPTAGSGVDIFSTVGSASRVLNIVSTGEIPGELCLTFTFEWEHTEIKADSQQAVEKQREYQESAPRAVRGTVEAIRRMVKEGKL